jgi:hypothetical protein
MAILMSAFSEASSSSEEEEEVGGGSELSRGGKFTVGEQIYQGSCLLLYPCRVSQVAASSAGAGLVLGFS